MSQNAPHNIPLWETIVRSYAFACHNFSYMLKISWLWVILIGVYEIAGLMAGQERTSFPFWFLNQAMQNIAIASIAVGWHTMLLQKRFHTGYYYLKIDQTVLGYWLVVTFLELLPTAHLIALREIQKIYENTPYWLNDIALIIAAILLFYSFIFSLALPGKALGWPGFPIGLIWDKIRTHRLKIFVGLACCFIPLLFTGLLIIEHIHIVPATLMTIGIVLLIKATCLSFLSFCFEILFSEEMNNANNSTPDLRIIKSTDQE